MDSENIILDKTEPLPSGRLLSGDSKGATTSSMLKLYEKNHKLWYRRTKSGDQP